MKRQTETATETPAELRSHDGADLTLEALTASELFKANDVGLQTPGDAAVSALERPAVRRHSGVLLAWTKRQVTMQWALAGFWGAILLTARHSRVFRACPADSLRTSTWIILRRCWTTCFKFPGPRFDLDLTR